MATNDSTGPGDEAVEGSWSPRRSRSSSAKGAAGKSAKDPEVLAGEIEKTREELAETLDAIADKVSPKKVADRTKKKVKDSANDAVAAVKETASGVTAKAADVTGTAKQRAATAAETARERVAGTGGSDSEGSPTATPLAASALSNDTVALPGAEVPYEPAPTPGALADAAVVSTEPPGAESWAPAPTAPSSSRPSGLAAAGAALVVLLLVLRRRKRRR